MKPSLENRPPTGPSWRAITSNDLEALVDLANEYRLGDDDLAFLNEPDILFERNFQHTTDAEPEHSPS